MDPNLLGGFSFGSCVFWRSVGKRVHCHIAGSPCAPAVLARLWWQSVCMDRKETAKSFNAKMDIMASSFFFFLNYSSPTM